jgi:hypothetical protein
MLHLSPLKIQSASPILGLMALSVLQQQSSNNTTNLLLNFFSTTNIRIISKKKEAEVLTVNNEKRYQKYFLGF